MSVYVSSSAYPSARATLGVLTLLTCTSPFYFYSQSRHLIVQGRDFTLSIGSLNVGPSVVPIFSFLTTQS